MASARASRLRFRFSTVTPKTRTMKATSAPAMARLRFLRAASSSGVRRRMRSKSRNGESLDKKGGEQGHQIEDREGEQVARRFGLGADVIQCGFSPHGLGLVGLVASARPPQADSQPQEAQTAQDGNSQIDRA